MNVPIPPLFLYEKDYNQYEIMDGRQRLEAISEFLEDKYALTGLEFWPELQAKKFSNLPTTIQRGFLRRTINAVVLLAETARSDSFDIRLILFRRLNTGGIKLNPQELRNALYPGSFNQMLHEISREDIFTQVWKIPKKEIDEDISPSELLQKNVLYKTMMDCELVLRFFAIHDAVFNITKGSLRQIFDRTMERYSSIDDTQISQMKNDFLTTLNGVVSALGEDFHILPDGRQQSRPLYDAILVAAYLNPGVDLTLDYVEIKARLRLALGDDSTYDVLVGRGNTLEAIKERVKIASTILSGI